MNQLALDYAPRALHPKVGTQAYTLLLALYRGERLTVWKSLNAYHCAALSQRMGDLRRLGWPIQERIVPGHKHSEYWIDFQ